MIKCPMCSALGDQDARQCRKCKADLALLAEYVSHLRDGLSQAESHTRSGDLGEAVWAYLAVLEVDPDNATARRQVGKVVTAVRQFDRTAPGRRWLNDMRQESIWQRWFGSGEDESGSSWGWSVVMFLLLFASIALAYYYGVETGRSLPPPMAPAKDDEAKKPLPKQKKPEDPKDKPQPKPKQLGG